MKRKSFEKSVAERRDVADELSPEDISLSNHQTSHHDASDTHVVIFIEVVRQVHRETDYEDEEDYKLFEGHEGSEGHDGNAVGREDVDGAHDEGVWEDVEDFLAGEEGSPSHFVVEEDDEESLDHEDLGWQEVPLSRS